MRLSTVEVASEGPDSGRRSLTGAVFDFCAGSRLYSLFTHRHFIDCIHDQIGHSLMDHVGIFGNAVKATLGTSP
jgi:hypothetical protein